MSREMGSSGNKRQSEIDGGFEGFGAGEATVDRVVLLEADSGVRSSLRILLVILVTAIDSSKEDNNEGLARRR